MAPPLVNAASSEADLTQNNRSHNTRVLLVEDNASDAQLVCLALSGLRDRESFGLLFEVTLATRLSQATICLANQTFDIILLDLSLPDCEGFEHTFSHVHQMAPAVPIIVLTGFGDEELGLKMVRDGAEDYLIKSRVERYLLVKAIRYAMQRQKAKRQHAELRLKLITVQEQERHRIARELHDQLAQSIVALSLGLKTLATSCEERSETLSRFRQLQNITNDLAEDIHTLALDLRPTALDDLGLEMTLANYLERWSSHWQIAADFQSQGFKGRRLATHIETTFYRIAQAALANIVRHARAQTVSVILKRADDLAVVIIEDDGCGFDVEAFLENPATERQLGLLGMEERVALVAGTLTIESIPHVGTSVYVRIPIQFQENGELAPCTN